MRKGLFAIGAICSCVWIAPALAQTVDDTGPVAAVITGPDEVKVGRTIVLDASASKTATGAVTYEWYINGRPEVISRTVEAIFTPEQDGESSIRLIVSQVIDGRRIASEATKVITAFTRKIVLIADQDLPGEKIAIHQQTANDAGVFLQTLQSPTTSIPLGLEESLAQHVGDNFDRVANADAIVVWTKDPVAGMQGLMRSARGDENRLQILQASSVVIISEGSLNTLGRAVRAPFSIIKPLQLLLTRNESINPLLEAVDMASFLEELNSRDIEVVVMDASTLSLRPWNVLTILINYMLTHGVASQTVVLLLMLPVIATILAFLKQVIGITTFGLYTPSIIALSFLALGWPIGIVLLAFILISGYIARKLLKHWRLLYIPKIAIILTVVSITLLGALALGAALDIVLATDTIFVLLIMSTLSESFLNLEGSEGKYAALYSIIETILAALLCVFIVRWPMLQSFIMAYPESVLITLIINFFVGRFTGLRLVEYFRFREVFKQLQEE